MFSCVLLRSLEDIDSESKVSIGVKQFEKKYIDGVCEKKKIL